MSFLGSPGAARRVGAALLRHRMITATAGAAAAVIVVGGCAAVAHGSGQETLTNAGDAKQVASPKASPTVPPLQLLSATPAGGEKDANGGAPITLTFSAPLSASTPLPSISPKVAGSWQVSGATATFTPATGFLPGTKVTVTVPAGMTGAKGNAPLAAKSALTFKTGSYSTLGLQQLLAQLGYLPLTFTPTDTTTTATATAGATAADTTGTGTTGTGTTGTGTTTAAAASPASIAYAPPAGTFAFQSGYPSQLTSQWKAGKDNILVTGAIRAFESDQGLQMDGTAGPSVWAHLLKAAAKGKKNPNGYTYALASQYSPNETLKVWHNGKVVLNTAANTGIPAAPTADGTYPVYERLQSQVMTGKNPDGSKYSDQVYWVAYFDGGDAVHYFSRPSYGSYQSLGCVELPYDRAKFIWPYLTYGTLVTVRGPVA